MTTETQENQPCEACGCSAEMGFMITEGDDVAEVSVYAENKAQLEAELGEYLALAKTVNAEVKYEAQEISDTATELHARFQFECSAEKLIFELKSRSLAK